MKKKKNDWATCIKDNSILDFYSWKEVIEYNSCNTESHNVLWHMRALTFSSEINLTYICLAVPNSQGANVIM